MERCRKHEIPVFNGDEDAYSWIQKSERYFHIKGATEDEKIHAVMVALEGRALSWYQWWKTCNPNNSWEGFIDAISECFQPTVASSPFAASLALKQGDVEEFVEHFKRFC